MISGISSMNAYSYSNVLPSNGASGKIYVPVQPGLVKYSQFKHISGIPASKGQHGVNISKVQILNHLIDQLVSMKKMPQSELAENITLSDSQVDTLIKDYQAKIQTTVETAKLNPYALGGGSAPQPGVLFSISY
ncbi:MAG: hypothetical protein J5747_09375 [Spirochaetaceae bacterium]|nr:hypothetical protein [Spirochaetaceae bacterium]MBO4704602.1 hypothetical protein [Spirochaetaceae bacterium]